MRAFFQALALTSHFFDRFCLSRHSSACRADQLLHRVPCLPRINRPHSPVRIMCAALEVLLLQPLPSNRGQVALTIADPLSYVHTPQRCQLPGLQTPVLRHNLQRWRGRTGRHERLAQHHGQNWPPSRS